VRGLAAAGHRRRALMAPRLLRAPPAAPAVPGTFTLNPVAASGQATSESATSYAVARSGGAITVSPGADFFVGQYYFPGDTYTAPYWDVFLSFLSFDTSGVVGTITAATLSLGLSSDSSTVDFTMQARVRDWGATLEAADYVPGADLGALTLAATLATAGIGAAGAYKDMAENGTNLRGAINQAGFTRLLLCSDLDVAGTAPTGFEYLILHHYAHATLKPKLVVTTT